MLDFSEYLGFVKITEKKKREHQNNLSEYLFKTLLKKYFPSPQVKFVFQELFNLLRLRIIFQTHRKSEGFIDLGETKIGGNPDVPSDFEWPYWNDRPLSFLMQLNLKDITGLNGNLFAAKKGILYFFYDFEQEPIGFTLEEKGGWRVIYCNIEDSNLVREPNPSNEREHRYFACKTWISESISLPSHNSKEIKRLDLGLLEKNYRKLFLDIFYEGPYLKLKEHWLFGYPIEVEYEGMESYQWGKFSLENFNRDKQDWILLLQLCSDSKPGWNWMDFGHLYFWIKREDLRKNRFDDVWMLGNFL